MMQKALKLVSAFYTHTEQRFANSTYANIGSCFGYKIRITRENRASKTGLGSYRNPSPTPTPHTHHTNKPCMKISIDLSSAVPLLQFLCDQCRLRSVWSESSLIAYAFYNPRAIQRGIINENCHTGCMYRLIWVFAGQTGFIVGFVIRRLIWH